MTTALSQHFVDAAKALTPQIRAAAEEIERMRRLPPPLVEAIARAGLFRLWIPRELGGEETDPMTLVRVVEEVARADGAAGWCVAIGGNTASSEDISRRTQRTRSTAATRSSSPAAHFDRRGKPWSWMAATALPAAGRSAAVASIPPGSSAAAGSSTAIGRA
jgi:alkylation response protein AidB-like acyl-CoA dehydrogenase